ncbi:MAG TPA: carboxypeptidase regulatory-like domain-containing protein [Thermoanaerobaculia bacterium]|jgi:outer membrane receptor for ferrienterochelin and colicin
MSARRRLLLFASMLLLAFPIVSHAQLTTGNLAGTVVGSDGSALPGVTIEAVHVPTGTRYSDVSGANGRFLIPNVRVGGPYRVTANLEGFRPFTSDNVNVALGNTTEVAVTLQLAAVTESITVTADTDPIINPNRTGSTSTVSEQTIETLPTVNRSLQDFARTNPYFRVDPTDVTATRVNVAGRNNRYNSIQIDGAVNNDLFGLADTGTPGGQTDAQPISLDAIEQLQLVLSPYDVRQGGFTGGGINAVTRSGTNDWKGSVFGSKRSQDLVGEGPLDVEYKEFKHDQYGGRLGGPILHDRLFFFATGEFNRRNAPTGASAGGDASTQFRNPAEAARVSELLRSRYNYDPGPLTDIQLVTDSDTFFGRLDWNAGNKNQVTLRHNYVDATRDISGTRTEARFTFPTAQYVQLDKTNSTVLQVNSILSANAFNEGRVNFTTIRDLRQTPIAFPAVEIGGANQNATITAGTERFSGANALDQDILEVTDDFTWTRGAHTLVFGTHNEFFDFKNLFLSDVYGAYFFGAAPGQTNNLATAMANFEANRPTEYRITFATGADPRRATSFGAAQLGLYVNDSWRLSNQLTLSLGLRADRPSFPDTPSANPVAVSALGYRTDVTPSEKIVWSPRIGFNWNPHFGGNQQVRGGVGVFAGRTPFVWISNVYAGTGIEQVSLTCRLADNCPVPAFNPDPSAQPTNLGAAGATVLDLMDPDFEFPRVARATLGYDRDLFWGIRGTIEGVYSKTLQDVFYYNVRYRQAGVNPIDNRPTYTPVTPQVADAFLVSNTSKGFDKTATIQLTRPFSHGVTAGMSYAYQDAKSAFDATSSRGQSNWRFRHTQGDIFQDDPSNSAFEIEQRMNAWVTYDFRTGPLTHGVGFFYNMQAGRPFSMLQGNDANNDLNASNDLLYVPAQGQVIYQFSNGSTTRTINGQTQTAEQVFTQFMKRFGYDPYAGRIVDRYEFQEPWNRELDFHYELGFALFGTETSVTFDVLNALNLIDKDYGTVRSIANQNTTIATIQAQRDPATGKPIYRESGVDRWNADTLFTLGTNDIRSRWQGRLGVRFTF